MIQLGWNSKTCSIKGDRHKKPHVVWFHWYEMSRKGQKSAKNRLVVT